MFSFIIPLQSSNNYLLENLDNFKKIIKLYNSYSIEIILLPDVKIKGLESYKLNLRQIVTGPIPPPRKRDIGVLNALYEIICFIDEDSYISKEWIDLCYTNHILENYGAVVGPGIIPRNDPFIAQIFSTFYSSTLFSLFPERYLSLNKKFEVMDWPTVNFTIKKKYFLKVNGFDTDIWPGEDTYFCKKLANKQIKIIYDGKMYVYHHRRNSLKKYLVQIYRYGFNRGKLFILLGISMQIKFYLFFIILFVFFFISILNFSSFNHHVITFSFIFFIYIVLGTLESLFRTKKLLSLFNIILAPISHLSYLIGFINGIINKKRNTKLGR